MKRLLLRLFGVGVLVAAGYAAFHTAKTWPRCTITCDAHAIHFSADGATLVTGHGSGHFGNITFAAGGRGEPPLRVWDTRSGELERSLLSDVAAFDAHAVCEKRNLVAVELGATIRLADWQSGEEWNIDVGPGEVQRLTFSPRGDLLAAHVAKHPQPDVLIDVGRRAIARRLEAEASFLRFSADGSRWCYRLRDRMHVCNAATQEVEHDVPIGRFYADDRFYVQPSAESLDVVIRDGASLAVQSRVRPAPPPEFVGAESIDADDLSKIHACRHLTFAPNGRRVATFAQPFDADGVLEVWETETGRRLAAFPELKRGLALFCDDNLLLFIDRSHLPDEATTIAILNSKVPRRPISREAGSTEVHTMIDVESGAIRWRRTAPQCQLVMLRKDVAVQTTSDGAWDIFDAASGAPRSALAHPFRVGHFSASSSEDQRLVYAYGWRRQAPLPTFLDKWLPRWFRPTSGAVQVLDPVNERILLDLAADAGTGAVLSRDGATLLTHDSRPIGFGGPAPAKAPHYFRFYDLHSRKPWLWAAAAPAGLFGLAWSWRRWRRKRA